MAALRADRLCTSGFTSSKSSKTARPAATGAAALTHPAAAPVQTAQEKASSNGKPVIPQDEAAAVQILELHDRPAVRREQLGDPAEERVRLGI